VARLASSLRSDGVRDHPGMLFGIRSGISVQLRRSLQAIATRGNLAANAALRFVSASVIISLPNHGHIAIGKNPRPDSSAFRVLTKNDDCNAASVDA
jgi:hypothetical protein